MQALHDDVLAGHLGVAKTYEVIRQDFIGSKCFKISSIIAALALTVRERKHPALACELSLYPFLLKVHFIEWELTV